jgi:hypothetical protein
MATAQPTPAPLATAGPATLRIVLFGLPDAGKSSLLGALAQAAQTQSQALNGRLVDLTQGLAELRQRLYELQPRQTTEEIVPYPVIFEPSEPEHSSEPEGQRGTNHDRIEAVLVDCDGRVANEYLSRARSLNDAGRNGTLGQSLLEADTLILAVDASSSPAQLRANFTQFGRFLRLLQQSRGQRTDVSGLPVFLVLTKCDLLATSSDSPATWLDLIEARKLDVARQFEEFRSQSAAAGGSPFGRVDLHLWATAVKRPELVGSPARPHEPFGVAELFRQCFSAARTYRGWRDRSSRRLLWTIGGSVGALAVLASIFVVLVFTSSRRIPSPLETAVDRVRSQEQAQSPAGRLRNPQVRITELNRLVQDPAFVTLPETKQEYVRNRLRELKTYHEYETALQGIASPHTATTLEQLDQIEASLRGLPVPEAYRGDWALSEAGRQHADWLEDVGVLRTAIKLVVGWYQERTRRGTQVLKESRKPDLPDRARAVLKDAASPPFPEKDLDRPVPGSKRVTYATVFGFRSVTEARASWQAVREKLEPAAKLP